MSVSPTPAIAPMKMREVLRMISKPFVLITSFAPTALLWPPLVCQDYGSCTPLRNAPGQASRRRQSLESWGHPGILMGHCAVGPNSAKHAKADRRPRA